ncbi:hypothetical protein O6H91_09G083600 [Diphasiastrum complanatum]|uniref:Uncharacterized protein n=1 Tax=Diphasiastrum complanatum TaxID=34168 RepID=A0ACC2CRD6_DIPCM|nr:hypothetical protein O6H91_09G083600 [Diphasiastrum complanatum]
MCGRARCTLASHEVAQACGFPANVRSVDSERYRPSYNVAPGSYLPVVHYESKESSKEPVVHCMKWGLVPSFTKKGTKPDHYRMFNARSESVRQKSSFSRLLSKHRCLVSAEGFYEWKKDGAKKQPYYLHFEDGHPLVFAALYDCWENSEDRMPVILDNAESIHAWIDQELAELEFQKLLRPYEGHDLVWYPVTPAMGKPSFDGPQCVEELKPKSSSKSLMSQLFSKAKSEKSDSESTDIHSFLRDGSTSKVLSSADYSEAALSEEEKKAVAAGMEPDEEKPKEVLSNHGDREHDSKVRNSFGMQLPQKHSLGESCAKSSSQDTKEDKVRSEIKRRKTTDSLKSTKGDDLICKDHQKTLLTFFHKQ